MIANASVACFDGLFKSPERAIHIAGIRNDGYCLLNLRLHLAAGEIDYDLGYSSGA